MVVLFRPECGICVNVSACISERDCDIVQIAAWCGSASFMRYVTPTKPINFGASLANHITMDDDNNKMFLDDKEVPCIEPRRALNEFVEYINEQGESVVLVAHSGYTFDFLR